MRPLILGCPCILGVKTLVVRGYIGAPILGRTQAHARVRD